MSEELLFNGILFVASVVVATTLFVKALTRDSRVKKVMREFGSMKGLRPGVAKFAGDLLLEGENKGFPFAIERIRRHGRDVAPPAGKSSWHAGPVASTYTRMRLTMSGLPSGLAVYGENQTRKPLPRTQVIRTGDPEIDGYFTLKGRDPEEVLRFLTPERLSALKTHLKGREQIELRNNELLYERKNDVTKVSDLSRIYKKMGDFAEIFGGHPAAEGRPR